jgi:hypothetical protein
MENINTPFNITNHTYNFTFVSDDCMYSRPYPKKPGYPYQLIGVNFMEMPPFFRMGEHYKWNDISAFLNEHPEYRIELLPQSVMKLSDYDSDYSEDSDL